MQKHVFFLMLSPNWPPGKYIQVLSYHQQYIGLHRYHIIPYKYKHNLTYTRVHTSVFKTRGHSSGLVWSRQCNVFSCLDQSCVAKAQLEPYMFLNVEVCLHRLEQLYPMIGLKTFSMHYTCLLKMVICYKSMYILHMT